MNRVINMGRAKGKLRTGQHLTGHERNLLCSGGGNQAITQLKRREEREAKLYDPKEVIRMKMTVKQLSHPVFIGTCQKLDRFGQFPSTEVAWRIMKLIRACNEEMKVQREMVHKLAKEYAEVDERGEVKLTDAQEIVYKDPAKQDEHQKKFEELMAIEVEIAGVPVSLAWVDQAKLSPMELDVLEPLLDKATIPA